MSVEADHSQIPMLMGRLIEQQDTIIRLVEQIAHGHGGNSSAFKKDKETIISDYDDDDDDSSAKYDEQLPEQARIRRLKLYRAALTGDWEVAKRIYEVYESEIGIGITKRGDTALHIAAARTHTDFVKEIMKMLKLEDLVRRNKRGATALFFAAASGMVETARVMMKHNKSIAMVRNYNQNLPIEVAASLGHKDMVVYLYEQTKDSLNDEDCIELLVTLIETDLFDVAMQVLKDRPQLAIYRARNHETALHALALKKLTSSNFAHQNQQGIFRRCFNIGCMDVENKRQQALKLVERLWERVVLLSDLEVSKLITKPRALVFDAVKQGNVEFLTILIHEYPNLVWIRADADDYSIFHFAVLNRQEHIFKLFYKMGSAKDLIAANKDRKGHNILHLAGLLAPQDRLSIVSGAALQMQRELLWFKEVEKVVPQRFTEVKNREGLTPRALFTREHKDLRKEGEKWMKDTATSCMLVATLIATVVFSAAFTVPGSNRDDTGLPFFLETVSYLIFSISDAISLVSSSASIVTFSSILTSRYAEEDFLWMLPSKLLLGLATLFVSIAAMMVVFSATFFIVFCPGMLWIAIAVAAIASIPVIMFIWQHFQLFYDVLRSTYVSDSLFQIGKTSLFHIEEEASERQKNTKMLHGHLTIQCTCSTNV